jgi:hypothetical protein
VYAVRTAMVEVRNARLMLTKMLHDVGSAGEAELRVRFARPAQAIASVAADEHAALACVGSAPARRWLGRATTAFALEHRSPCPVLVVPAGALVRDTVVVVCASDEPGRCGSAAPVAAQLAFALGAPLAFCAPGRGLDGIAADPQTVLLVAEAQSGVLPRIAFLDAPAAFRMCGVRSWWSPGTRLTRASGKTKSPENESTVLLAWLGAVSPARNSLLGHVRYRR